MKRSDRSPLRKFLFAIILGIFLIMLTVMTLQSLLMFLYLRFVLGLDLLMPQFWRPIPLLIVISSITGCLLTVLLSRMPLKPIRELVDAINQLAEGNFKVRVNLNLTQEFELLSQSFNRMAQELENTELLRSDFINNFSHEFKTPIVSLRGFAKILKNDDLTKEERNEYLDIIISESNRLSQLAANVLNLSKVENLSILTETETFSLTEEIRQSILLLESKWQQKKIQLIIDMDELEYFGNKILLNQVWINLIDNAIKFSPEGGEVKIKLQKKDSQLHFSVMDNGCGMDETVKSHIFERFYQGDTSHRTEGNGIGLALVQKIVKLHKGEILVDSEVGIGTTFRVALPLKIK